MVGVLFVYVFDFEYVHLIVFVGLYVGCFMICLWYVVVLERLGFGLCVIWVQIYKKNCFNVVFC